MHQQTTIQDKKSVLRDDRALVCCMLVVYGACILGLIGTTVWALDRRSKKISAEATSTVSAAITQRANATATASARTTEQTVTAIARPTLQAQYAIVDRFNDNHEAWLTESSIDDEFMVGSVAIHGGIYAWTMREVKQPFIWWDQFRYGRPFEDFDMYIDSKIKTADGTPEGFCSGFIFRTASADLEEGTYVFSVCNDSHFSVDYYEQEEWETLSGWLYSRDVRADDWNRLEVSARGDHFTFLINNEAVFEMTDDRQPKGGVGLFVDIGEEKPVSIWFDNFGFQSR